MRVTVSPALMTALFQGFKALFSKGFAAAEIYYKSIVMEVPSTTSQEVYGWLGQTTGFREWLGDRVIQTLKTHDFTIKNREFENTVGVKKTQIDDDQVGVLSPVFEQLGRDAQEFPDLLVAEALKNALVEKCYDGKAFFASDHPVYKDKDKSKATPTSNVQAVGGNNPRWYLFDTSKAIKPLILQTREKMNFVRKDQAADDTVFFRGQAVYGADCRMNVGFGLWQLAYSSNEALTDTTFKAARAAMESLKGDNGRSLKVRPIELHVPTALRSTAEALFETQFVNGGDTNPLFKAIKVVVNPNLD